MTARTETIGDATLYLGDCREIVGGLQGVDAVVSDPPYGMGWDTKTARFSGGNTKRGVGRSNWGDIEGDDEPFDPTPWLTFKHVAMWGANHYANRLPVGKTLVWIKRHPEAFGTFLSDCEIGWATGGHGVYAKYKQFPPPSRMAENYGQTAHPTQKPIELMAWCIGMFPGARTILDPYMGSGTCGVAALRMGRKFIGIERSEQWFDVACRRIDAAHREPGLGLEAPAAPERQEQASLL